jgi:hypothetical protein
MTRKPQEINEEADKFGFLKVVFKNCAIEDDMRLVYISVIEHLPSMCKALGSITSTEKKRRQNKQCKR